MAHKTTDHFEELKKSISSDGQRILTGLLNSPGSGFSSDIFSLPSEKITGKPGETVRIACLDIGSYRPQDMTWRVEGDHVLLQGKRTQRIDMGVEGAKFTRAVPIPEGVDPKRITARYSALDGQYIIEGVKMNTSHLRKKKTSVAYFDESKMSLTVDLGSDKARQELNYACDGSEMNLFDDAARNSSVHKPTTDKIVI